GCLGQDGIESEAASGGRGRPVVYLHGPWGLAPDRAFVAGLADRHTVYAPKFPGTTRGNPDAVHALDNWFDLILYYGELFDKLELSAPAVVGHSFGGLLPPEFAASAPKSVGRLVLIDPVGFWRGAPRGYNRVGFMGQHRPRPPFCDRRRGGGAAGVRSSCEPAR